MISLFLIGPLGGVFLCIPRCSFTLVLSRGRAMSGLRQFTIASSKNGYPRVQRSSEPLHDHRNLASTRG